MSDPFHSGTQQAWGRASGPRAGFWRRFGAAIIDGIIVGIVGGVLGVIVHNGVGSVLEALVSVAYFTGFEGSRRGAGLGKQAMGIRVIDANTGGPIGYPRAFVRWIGGILCAIPIFLGYFWMLWDSEKQCWNDKLAGDYCVFASDYPVMDPASY